MEWAKARIPGAAYYRNGRKIGEDGINGLTISNAMHLSPFLGGKMIELAFDDDLYYEKLMKRVRDHAGKRESNRYLQRIIIYKT